MKRLVLNVTIDDDAGGTHTAFAFDSATQASEVTGAVFPADLTMLARLLAVVRRDDSYRRHPGNVRTARGD